MPFSISEIIVSDTADKVVALNWTYENAEGKLSNQWKLAQPYGTTPLNQCTTNVLIGWLEEQLPNTQAEFDTAISNAKAQQQFSETLKPFTPHNDGPPTPVVMPAPVPEESTEELVTADIKPKRGKK